MRIPLSLVMAPALLVAGACGQSPDPGSADGEFVAFNSTFAGFESWPSSTTDGPVVDGSTHVSGIRIVYINQLPPPGATAFPVGTVIVKVTQADQKIFARAKRGHHVNPTGAVDWEWFELNETAAKQVSIIWRGSGPPAGGDQYGGDPNVGCNTCHALAPANDYVLSPWLELAGADGAVAPQDGSADASADGPEGIADATLD